MPCFIGPVSHLSWELPVPTLCPLSVGLFAFFLIFGRCLDGAGRTVFSITGIQIFTLSFIDDVFCPIGGHLL